MNAEETAMRMLLKERTRIVNRQYDAGGWLIAVTPLTIEVEGEPLVIPAGHRLTYAEALNYPGDVQFAHDRRQTWRGSKGTVRQPAELRRGA
jgi:hypothetical protein